MSDETPAELAKTYLSALESSAADGEHEEALNRRDALRERLERFEESYGDSDPATQELREKVEDSDDRVTQLEKNRQAPEKAEHELLEAATSFMLDDRWLKPKVIEALNRALVGERHAELHVDDIELSGVGDAEDLDDVDHFDIIDVVRKLVLDKLGETDDVEQVWQSLEGSSREGPFRIVADSGEADPEDVMQAMDEDIERSVARNRLKSAVYQLEINPYHREDGTYHLSTTGRYIAAKYAEAGDSDERAGDEEEERGGEEGGDGQTTLVNGSAAANGGDADE
jgi:hypothetical protein